MAVGSRGRDKSTSCRPMPLFGHKPATYTHACGYTPQGRERRMAHSELREWFIEPRGQQLPKGLFYCNWGWTRHAAMSTASQGCLISDESWPLEVQLNYLKATHGSRAMHWSPEATKSSYFWVTAFSHTLHKSNCTFLQHHRQHTYCTSVNTTWGAAPYLWQISTNISNRKT